MAVDKKSAACSVRKSNSSSQNNYTGHKDTINNKNTKKLTRKETQVLKRTANRARHRLLSIQYDIDTFVRPTLTNHPLLQDLPVIANERCGSWYVHGLLSSEESHSSSYFKSTDGHVGTYNFSLKRLNLNVVNVCCIQNSGCVIVDASVKKPMPDSFARTIPIWCCVLNRITQKYRQDLGLPLLLEECDTDLYTPDWIVSKEEHSTISSLTDERVQELYDCQAIVDPTWLATTLTKPLRPFWITPQDNNLNGMNTDEYYSIVCLNASQHCPNRIYMDSFWYTSGAADDEQEWARHLTPELFWKHANDLLKDGMTDDDTDVAIDAIVSQYSEHDNTELLATTLFFDRIGETNIALGSRRAGRPPECWKHFDAILNVTDMEYDNIHDSCHENRYYLQLPVKEGKRDKSELEHWMAVGIVFCMLHAQQGKRTLIHCAQGKDRSVAVCMAVVVLFCKSTFPLQWKSELNDLNVNDLMVNIENDGANDDGMYKSSGLPTRLVSVLQGRQGRDTLLEWARKELYSDSGAQTLANKESLRRTLHLIRQDREKAEPSRSTMQKLNRFFMSGTYDGPHR